MILNTPLKNETGMYRSHERIEAAEDIGTPAWIQ
jgi:hypothetical protein